MLISFGLLQRSPLARNYPNYCNNKTLLCLDLRSLDLDGLFVIFVSLLPQLVNLDEDLRLQNVVLQVYFLFYFFFIYFLSEKFSLKML